jgi:putative ABC transport system permease protein
VALFGLTAMVLAAIGAYGVMAAAVAARTRELGVRSALGASAAGSGGLLRALLYDVAPRDPRMLGAAAATVVSVALAAAWVPARRAARINPVDALRVDG